MRMLAAIGPWFARPGFAADDVGVPRRVAQGDGRMHVVESTNETTHLGVYDTTLTPISKSIQATSSATATRGRTFSTSSSPACRSKNSP
ncbi:MAG: hypothetical protein WBD74_00515 [Candidatus Aquilonibacter sp.]